MAMSPDQELPVVPEKRTVVTDKPVRSMFAFCHDVPWLPDMLHRVVHVLPASDDVSNASVPMVPPYMWYQKSTDRALRPLLTSLCKRKGPFEG